MTLRFCQRPGRDGPGPIIFFVYVVSLVTSAVTLTLGCFWSHRAFRIIRRHVINAIRTRCPRCQVSSERIGGVVGGVGDRTRRSGDSIRDLSRLTAQISAALEEIAGGARRPFEYRLRNPGDAADMSEECRGITVYAG